MQLLRSTAMYSAYHFKKVIKYPKPTNIMTSTANGYDVAKDYK